jgi:hypothetical protein
MKASLNLALDSCQVAGSVLVPAHRPRHPSVTACARVMLGLSCDARALTTRKAYESVTRGGGRAMNPPMTTSTSLPAPAVVSDASLLVAARTDPDAFRELYARYAQAVNEYFARRTGSRATALDLTAETFAQVWFVRARFRDEANGSAAPWIYGIARNVLLMSIRRGAIERRATERLGLQERLDHMQCASRIRYPTARGPTKPTSYSTPFRRTSAKPCACACWRTWSTQTSLAHSARLPVLCGFACTAG